MARSATAVTLAEYLSTRYHPDVEYVDGGLKEKPLVSPVHGRVQLLIGAWFQQHEEDWGVQTLVEARTQVAEEAVRLPDVSVLVAGSLPRKALVEPPLVAIEVLSAADSYMDLKKRAQDLHTMGVKNLWLIDPDARAAERWEGGSWHAVEEEQVHVPDSPVYLDLAWVWKKLGPRS